MGTTLDYYKLSRDIIRLLRADMSQRDMSSALGYSFNKVGKIESGQSFIKWKEFLDVAKVVNIDIKAHLKELFYACENTNWCDEEFGRFLVSNLSLKSNQDNLFKRVVKKLEERIDALDFAEFLQAIDKRSSTLICFLFPLIDCSLIPELYSNYETYNRCVNIIEEDPYIAYINCALVVEDYVEKQKHCDETLAHHVGCSVEKVREIFRLNQELGFYHFNGTHYEPSNLNFSFSNLNNKRIMRFNKLTLEIAASKCFINPSDADRRFVYNSGHVSCRSVCLSQQAAHKVNELMAKFHTQVNDIIEQDEVNDKTNLHYISAISVPGALNMLED